MIDRIGLDTVPFSLQLLNENEDGNLVDDSLQNPAVASHLAYYQRYLRSPLAKKVDEHFQKQSAERSAEWLPLDQYPPEQQRSILQNLCSVQLTYGCSGGCTFCGFDAVQRPREHLPFPAVRRLIRMLRETRGNTPRSAADKTFFYYASDPLDYRSTENGEERTYADVDTLVQQELGYAPFISTVAPKRSDDVLNKLHAQGRIIDRISITSEKHRASLEKRGILDLNVADKYPVEVRPIGKMDIYQWLDHDRPVNFPVSIGCFNGALMTPRGIYSVLNLPRITNKAPQGQYVVPFIGNEPSCPLSDANMEHVLSQHIPLSDASRGIINFEEAIGMHYDALSSTAFAIQLEDGAKKVLTCRGSRISAVENPDRYEFLAKFYATITNVDNERFGEGFPLSTARLAHITCEELPPEIPVDEDLLSAYLQGELSDTCAKKTADLADHPFLMRARENTLTNWKNTDYCNVRSLILISPHWLVAYDRIDGEMPAKIKCSKHPNKNAPTS